MRYKKIITLATLCSDFLAACAFIPIQKTTIAEPSGGSVICTQRGAGVVSYWVGQHKYNKCVENAQGMGAGMSRLIGQPLSNAVQKLGYPTDKTLTVGTDTVYVWEKDGCTIRAGVGKDDIISHATYEGDASDCKEFRQILAAQ